MSNNEPKKDMRGYLHPNVNKNKPTQPDLTGHVVINGEEFKLSVWENKTSEGKKYFSLIASVPKPSIKDDPNHNHNKPSTGATISNDIDEDLEAILNIADDDNPFN